MNLLLDTHAFLWWVLGDAALGTAARGAIQSSANPVHVSAATALEIAIKRRSGKLPGLPARGDIEEWIERESFTPLAIDVDHAVASADLPLHHRDPFDRLLVAQARLEGMTLVTSDAQIAKYRVKLLDAAA